MLDRVVVCVKQIMDTNVALHIDAGAKKVVHQDEPQPVYMINPADRCALEEAMYLQQRFGSEVIAITFGPDRAETIMRYCLARGADRAIHLHYPPDFTPDAWVTSEVIAGEIKEQCCDLVICGEKSLDNGGGQVGPIVAELLNLPQITKVIMLKVDDANKALVAHRLLERGDREVVECPLPALVTVNEMINQPRYVSIRKRLQIDVDTIESRMVSFSGDNLERRCRVLSVGLPKLRPRKITMPDAAMSASERMKFMMSGGKAKKESALFEGSTEEAVERVVNCLKEYGII